MQYYNTKQVAELLGINPAILNLAIWNNRLDPPLKGPSGNFLWTQEDIERASWTLLRKSYQEGENE